MSINPVSFSGLTPSKPALKKTPAAIKQSSVAFTGVNYGNVVKKCNFPQIFKEFGNLFRNFFNMLRGLKPHVNKADAALGRQMSKLWQVIKPV